MSNLIKLKDYSDVSEKNELTQEKLRDQLLKLSADNVFSIPEMSDEEKESFRVLANFNGRLWTQNYTGILQIEDRNVFISSRFDDDSCFFTQYILDKALGMKINIFQDMKPGVTMEAFWNSFWHLFLWNRLNMPVARDYIEDIALMSVMTPE